MEEPAARLLITLLDGTRDRAAIRAELQARTGLELSDEDLDNNLLELARLFLLADATAKTSRRTRVLGPVPSQERRRASCANARCRDTCGHDAPATARAARPDGVRLHGRPAARRGDHRRARSPPASTPRSPTASSRRSARSSASDCERRAAGALGVRRLGVQRQGHAQRRVQRPLRQGQARGRRRVRAPDCAPTARSRSRSSCRRAAASARRSPRR